MIAEIRDAKLALHPGDWFSQNVALAWQLVFSDLDPDLIVIDHSARYPFSYSSDSEFWTKKKTNRIWVGSCIRLYNYQGEIIFHTEVQFPILNPPISANSLRQAYRCKKVFPCYLIYCHKTFARYLPHYYFRIAAGMLRILFSLSPFALSYITRYSLTSGVCGLLTVWRSRTNLSDWLATITPLIS